MYSGSVCTLDIKLLRIHLEGHSFYPLFVLVMYYILFAFVLPAPPPLVLFSLLAALPVSLTNLSFMPHIHSCGHVPSLMALGISI